MSVTITWSTPDHRYFMRRTKSDIVRMIGELRGQPLTIGEHSNLMTLTKDQLASEAVRLVRALPPPPDPVEQMVSVITAELRRQADDDRHNSPYVGNELPEMLVDGMVNIRQLAQAVLKSGIITP